MDEQGDGAEIDVWGGGVDAQIEELPLPHVMACFDVKRHGTANDVRPILMDLNPLSLAPGQNQSLSWEQEAFLQVETGQEKEDFMSHISFRKNVLRDSWRLAHLRSMTSSRHTLSKVQSIVILYRI